MRSGTGYYILITLFILLLFGVISLGDILNMVAYIILGIIVLVVIGILMFRYRIRRLRKTFEQNNSSYGSYGSSAGKKQNGRVTITDNSAHHKNVRNDVGEYVEYEDIQEDESSDN